MKKIYLLFFLIPILALSLTASAKIDKVQELLSSGAGKSGNVPKGLQYAKGIQKKLPLVISNVQATSTTAFSTVVKWETNKESNGAVSYWFTATSSTNNAPVIVSASTTSIMHGIYLEGLSC